MTYGLYASILHAPGKIGERNMNLSLEEAVAKFNKWRDEGIPVFVFGQNVSQPGLRSVHESGVDWNISLRGTIAQVSAPPAMESPGTSKVMFEGPEGNLSLLINACVFSYSEPYEKPPFVKPDPRFKTLSCLFLFFPTNEVFAVYELREV
ncbi:MAG TPA: hypothetical protein VEI73_08135 [Candidatus Acidoferrum sp.]|nr:hypothetical protein [Candidatus Acidoferrum sp.]